MSDAGFILNATNELYRIFDALNENYFDGKLPKVVITIQSSVKAYGHFSSDRWKNKAEENEIIPDKEVEVAKDKKEIIKYHEINIAAEHLKRNIYHLCATLQHEMIHLYCHINDIKDTSNGNVYHNKRFKREAELRGLYIDRAPTIGWSLTEPTEEFMDFVENIKVKKELFSFFRKISVKVPSEKDPSKKTTKYTCSGCGEAVRGSLGLNILCKDCNLTMEPKDRKGKEDD
jgi:hypothetical protein